MNLIKGEIISSEESRKVLGSLDKMLANTLSRGDLSPRIVIDACDKLASGINQGHVDLLMSLGIPEAKCREYLDEAKVLMSRDSLTERLGKELGQGFDQEKRFPAKGGCLNVTEKICPLGVLLHITAGNQYGLAFYSVIEGLLGGNINLVKLSGKDDGLSVLVLSELIRIEPRLSEYIYVFDLPSSDKEAVSRLLDVADAVSVWGGDGAIAAVRRIAPTNTKIIEWGHKLSFAYAAQGGFSEPFLRDLAKNMIETQQLLCSSCQGIFVDTANMEDIYKFCDVFLPILDDCRRASPEALPIALQAQSTLKRYTKSLKSACRVFQGKQTSITAYEDSALELSIQHGNCWVRRLPRDEIISVLRPYKGHLQTAALLCSGEERQALSERLIKAGVVRITAGENMSQSYNGAAHDGDYSLRRYTRLVSLEIPK